MVRQLSIRARLIGIFALLLVLMAGIGLTGLYGAARIDAALVDVQVNRLPNISAAGRIDGLSGRYVTSLMRHILTTEPTMLTIVEKDLAGRQTAFDKETDAYAGLVRSDEERALYDAFVRDWRAFAATVPPILALSRAGEKAQALTVYETKGLAPRRAATLSMEKLIAFGLAGAAGAEAESRQTFSQTHGILIGAGLGALLLSILLGGLLVRSVGRGIASVVGPMTALAAGDLAVAIPHQGERTEIGGIADAVQVFKDGLIRMKALEDETALARAGAEAQRKAAMRDMADGFERAVGGIVGNVTTAATELQATARTLTATASGTAQQSSSVASAAEEAASNVNTVAAAAEELGSSVQEIGRQVDGSASLAMVAVTEADRTAALVHELSTAASKIGDVVAMIATIAGQTNLLALNATIEAARAGEAGRGFAVVASEVKELAGQTARATAEISDQIGRIQGSTVEAVTAIGGIAERIREISGVANAIAAAVEEQGAATQEIVRNVSQAAAGTGEVTANVSGLAVAAEETGTAAGRLLASASDLSRQSGHLDAEVRRFLDTVRAA